MPLTTTATLPPQIQQAYSFKLLSTPVPNLIYNIAAEKKEMPRNNGKILRMSRYNALDVAVVPLGNLGFTPPSQSLTRVDIDAEISFYGTWIGINEQVTLTNSDPVLNAASMRLGVSLRQSEDQLTRDMLAATAAFINCVGGVNGDNPTELTRSDIDDVVSSLLGSNAYTLLDQIGGQDKFGSAPVRDAYIALCHSDLMKSLDNVQGFTQKAQYPAPMNQLRSEWGAAGNLRFMLSSVGSIVPNASNLGKSVYNISCLGMESYAVIEQDGYSAQFIYIPATIAGGPLAQNATVGYKYATCPKILNDLWVLNLRCTI